MKGYVHEVVITCASDVIAQHERSYEREAVVFDPLHYLALIEQKTRALDQAAPLAGWQLPECFVKHLLLCRIERRPPRLDMTNYPHLPLARVRTTQASDYMSLLAEVGA